MGSTKEKEKEKEKGEGKGKLTQRVHPMISRTPPRSGEEVGADPLRKMIGRDYLQPETL